VLFPFFGTLVGMFDMEVYYAAMGAACFVTLWAVAGDLWAARRRDWPHWFGVALNIGGYVAMFIAWLASRFMVSEGV
jgi:hypothetical protein